MLQESQSKAADLRTAGDAAAATAAEAEIEEFHRQLSQLLKLKAQHSAQRDAMRRAAAMSAAAAERAAQEARLVDEAKLCLQVPYF